MAQKVQFYRPTYLVLITSCLRLENIQTPSQGIFPYIITTQKVITACKIRRTKVPTKKRADYGAIDTDFVAAKAMNSQQLFMQTLQSLYTYL